MSAASFVLTAFFSPASALLFVTFLVATSRFIQVGTYFFRGTALLFSSDFLCVCITKNYGHFSALVQHLFGVLRFFFLRSPHMQIYIISGNVVKLEYITLLIKPLKSFSFATSSVCFFRCYYFGIYDVNITPFLFGIIFTILNTCTDFHTNSSATLWPSVRSEIRPLQIPVNE